MAVTPNAQKLMRFYAAFSRRSLRPSKARRRARTGFTFLCRVLAAVPATCPSFNIPTRERVVSMPRSRGGPCDGPRKEPNGRSLQWFLCRVLAAVPATVTSFSQEGQAMTVSMPRSRGGPCDTKQAHFRPRIYCFYAAFSRRSLRQREVNHMKRMLLRFYAAFSRRSLRQAVRPLLVVSLCCFYAAFSRRSLRRTVDGVGFNFSSTVSMPRSRGGPCDIRPLQRLRPRHRAFLCRVLAAVPATGSASPIDGRKR